MKKTLFTTLAALAAASTILTASAAQEECTYFSSLSSDWGTVYTTDFYGSNGGITFTDGNVHVNSLPYGLMDQGLIYTICCYKGKLYYSTGPDGSDIPEPVKIYSCDLNGQNNRLLADNATAWSDIFIIDDELYYGAYHSEPSYGAQGYYGGIYKINLNNLQWKKIVSGDVELTYCDGDYAYFTNHRDIYAAIDTNGYNTVAITPNCDEFNYNIWLKGNYAYYISGTGLYVRTKNRTDSKKLCTVPQNSYLQISNISNITENYIYYSTINHSNYGSPKASVNRISRW